MIAVLIHQIGEGQISYMFEIAPATKLNNDTLKPRSCTKYMSLQLGYQMMEELPNRRYDDRFECTRREPLDNSSREQCVIICGTFSNDTSN